MPNITYTYRSLNVINWPAPGQALPPGLTTCHAAPTNALIGLPSPIVTWWPMLVNAAVITGVYPGPLALNQAEIAWRVNALRTASRTDAAGSLAATPVYTQCDPTEKGVLAYHLGSTLTGMLALAFCAPAAYNFMHLSRFLAVVPPGTVTFANAQRPDYLSQSFPGITFQVWEAKGRRGGAVPGVLRDAFNQTRAVATVNGGAPAGRVAVLAQMMGGRWNLFVTDPGEDTPADLAPGVQDAIFLEYYRPWRQLLEAESTNASEVKYSEATFTTVPFQPADVALGLDQRILVLLDASHGGKMAPGDLSTALQEVLTSGYKNVEGAQFVNPNGLYLKVGDIWKDW